MRDNFFLIVNSFYIVLITFISIIFYFNTNSGIPDTCELAGKVFILF